MLSTTLKLWETCQMGSETIYPLKSHPKKLVEIQQHMHKLQFLQAVFSQDNTIHRPPSIKIQSMRDHWNLKRKTKQTLKLPNWLDTAHLFLVLINQLEWKNYLGGKVFWIWLVHKSSKIHVSSGGCYIITRPNHRNLDSQLAQIIKAVTTVKIWNQLQTSGHEFKTYYRQEQGLFWQRFAPSLVQFRFWTFRYHTR